VFIAVLKYHYSVKRDFRTQSGIIHILYQFYYTVILCIVFVLGIPTFCLFSTNIEGITLNRYIVNKIKQ
jgi:hypothetical protein